MRFERDVLSIPAQGNTPVRVVEIPMIGPRACVNAPSGTSRLRTNLAQLGKAQARRRIPAWIEEYNHHRRHSSLGMLSPVAYELDLVQRCGHEHEQAA
jgi:transposase InsO family protein